MRALLDTHAFLWWITDDDSLSSHARRVLGDGSNELFVSAASAWEIAIKIGLGKLPFPGEASSIIPRQLSVNAFLSLPVEIEHALRVADLPRLHRDPFDRMLVAQAQIEKLPIISRDPEIARYDVRLIW